MSDSRCCVNLLPASSPCNILTLLHFNEKADLNQDLVGFLNICLSETCCKTSISPDLGSSKTHPCCTGSSCLGDEISAGGKKRRRAPDLPILGKPGTPLRGKDNFHATLAKAAYMQELLRKRIQL